MSWWIWVLFGLSAVMILTMIGGNKKRSREELQSEWKATKEQTKNSHR